MTSATNKIDLLDPKDYLRDQYRNQIRHTIDSYSAGHIVVAEALQNALDAIAVYNSTSRKIKGCIDLCIDFDSSRVTVSDNGIGFPNDPRFLVLGGSDKGPSSRMTAGMVGVGIKVVLYCSKKFEIRSNTGDQNWHILVPDAYKFSDDTIMTLKVPSSFQPDPTPLDKQGTVVTYEFPYSDDSDKWKLCLFAEYVKDHLIDPQIEGRGYIKTLLDSKPKQPAAELFATYLRRFTYAGDTLGPVGGRDGLTGAKINLTVKSSNPGQLGQFWADHWGDKSQQNCTFEPSYLTVEKTVPLTKVQKPPIFRDKLGKGGGNLERTARGFNVTTYTEKDEFKQLLQNAKGKFPSNMEGYEKLFERTNCITVTVGRIPQFSDYLPYGSRRVISANGVVTEHDIPITSGRNQQYVRCIDLVLDVDAQLNYGKTYLTDNHLVKLARDFINEAYQRTLQNAAAQFVGKIIIENGNGPIDIFWDRENFEALKYVPICKVPRDENDVIALFMCLLTAGYISDYLLYGLSQSDRYDARMLIMRESDREDLFENPKETDLKTVEFKYSVYSVIRDFEREIKDPRDIQLVIAWNQGSVSGKNFAIEDIVHSRVYLSSPKKIFPSVNYFISDNRTDRQVQLLLLEPLIKSIRGSAATS